MNSEFDIKFVNLIKQEAIKWVKHHQTYLIGYEEQLINEFIQTFFNLTEEELK